jgi:hypothetical protein
LIEVEVLLAIRLPSLLAWICVCHVDVVVEVVQENRVSRIRLSWPQIVAVSLLGNDEQRIFSAPWRPVDVAQDNATETYGIADAW